MYSVSVTGDGVVSYEGRQQVRRLGTATARTPTARVASLLRELEAAGYFEFAGRYRPSAPVGGRYLPTYETVITSVSLGDRLGGIEHDHGCGDAPPALADLERSIDEALGSTRWTGR
jgi:hypothetical protein